MEERRLGAFDNKVIRISEPIRDEVTRGERKMHNEKLHNLYTSPNIIMVIFLRKDWRGM
jgi:hypothetical protein